jgi:hypothetical protein
VRKRAWYGKGALAEFVAGDQVDAPDVQDPNHWRRRIIAKRGPKIIGCVTASLAPRRLEPYLKSAQIKLPDPQENITNI